jgi:hypothetical protein
MKNKLKHFIIMLSFFMISLLHAQQNEQTFEIKFFNDRGSIGLICDKGCTWTDLWITKKSFYINQFGMVDINSIDEINNSDFILSVEKKGSKIYLKAKKGVKWKELIFKLPKDKTKPVIINNYNIVSE